MLTSLVRLAEIFESVGRKNGSIRHIDTLSIITLSVHSSHVCKRRGLAWESRR